jgi:hypothetical protein
MLKNQKFNEVIPYDNKKMIQIGSVYNETPIFGIRKYNRDNFHPMYVNSDFFISDYLMHVQVLIKDFDTTIWINAPKNKVNLFLNCLLTI